MWKSSIPALRCGYPTRYGQNTRCRRLAGNETRHQGYGHCRQHQTADEDGAWVMAIEIAREERVTPWEALLLAVRRSAGRVLWIDAQLEEAYRANDGGDSLTSDIKFWIEESRKERMLMTRSAKAAIDAGVAERLVRQVEMEGRFIAEVLGRVLDKLGLDTDRRAQAFAEAQTAILELDPAENPE